MHWFLIKVLVVVTAVVWIYFHCMQNSTLQTILFFFKLKLI